MAKKKKKKSTAKKTASSQKNAAPPKKKNSALISFIIGLMAAIAVITTIALIAAFTGGSGTGQQSSAASTEASSTLEEGKTYFADIDIKDYGLITVELDQKAAPETVKNFINLANSGFYDGLTFHRIMEGFMMQGGDPTATGRGGSDKKIVGEFSENGYENPISHVRGTISMARSSGDYNSASSQFFIVHKDSAFLDGKYAAFGKVTSGIEIVDKVCTDAKPTDNNGTIPFEQQPVINSIKIRES